jgi:hypothetical protein
MPPLIRFFRAVPPVPSLMLATFATVAAAGVLATAVDPAHALRAIEPIVLLQLFAASSGFAVAARRGHYDLLLTRGESRLRIALVQWGMAIAPGVAAWLLVAAAETLASGARGATLAPGTVAAMWLISTMPWALTVALPRFAGAIGWLLVLAMTRALVPLSALPPPLAGTLYPIALLGRDVPPHEAWLVLVPLLLGLTGLIAACAWIVRMNVPLEAAQ